MADTKTIHLTKEEWADLQRFVKYGQSFAVKRDGLTVRMMIPPGVPGDMTFKAADRPDLTGLVFDTPVAATAGAPVETLAPQGSVA